MLAQKRHKGSIRAPNHIFDWRGVDLRDIFLLLNIIQHDGSGGTKDQTRSASVEDLIGLHGGLDGLHDRI